MIYNKKELLKLATKATINNHPQKNELIKIISTHMKIQEEQNIEATDFKLSNEEFELIEKIKKEIE